MSVSRPAAASVRGLGRRSDGSRRGARSRLGCESLEHVREGDGLVVVFADVGGIGPEPHRVLGQAIAEEAAVRVDPAVAHGEQAVALLDRLPCARRATGSGVDAREQRRLLGEHALRGHERGDGDLRLVGETLDRVDRAEAIGVRVEEHRRSLGLGEALEDGLRARLEALAVARRRPELERCLGYFDLQVRDVRRELHVDGTLRRPRGLDHAVDLEGSVRGGELRVRRRHLRVGAIEVAGASLLERMVQSQVALDRLSRDRTADTDDGDVLAESARDAVHGAQRSDSVRDHEGRDAVHPRVAVGRVRCVQLVAVANPGWATSVRQLLQELQVEVAGHPEDMTNSDFLESPQQELADRLGLHRQPPHGSWAPRGVGLHVPR